MKNGKTICKIKNKLYKALNGKGAFSRFKKEIAYLGIREKWFAFRDERLKEKVKQCIKAGCLRDFIMLIAYHTF